jgi:formate hydrogenlyase transcriptional activator
LWDPIAFSVTNAKFNHHFVAHKSYNQQEGMSSDSMAEPLTNSQGMEQEVKGEQSMLDVCRLLAHVRSQHELDLILNHQLRDVLPTAYGQIFLLSNDGKHIADQFGALPLNESPAGESSDQSVFEKWLGPIGTDIISVSKIIDLSVPASAEIDHTLVSRGIKMQEVILFRPKSDDGSRGMIAFFSPVKEGLNEIPLAWLESIAAFISVSLGNISLHQQLAQQEKKNVVFREKLVRQQLENDVLLAIGSEMAANQQVPEVAAILRTKLADIVQFNDISICCFAPDALTYKFFTPGSDLSVALGTQHHSPDQYFTIHDGIQDVLLGNQDAVNFSHITLQSRSGCLAERLTASGIRSCAGIRLVSNNVIIGSLILTSNNEEGFCLQDLMVIQRLSHHLAAWMSNIQATEKVNRQYSEIKTFKEQLEKENLFLLKEANHGYSYNDIIGKSQAMQEVFHLLTQVAFTNSTVLLLGETGTGKELVARAIYNSSARREKLLVKVNCAAIPSDLVESELFGHERGSFTGAVEKHIGKFEIANHGTLFLDEIGELPLDVQAKLLRAIQEREIERVGGKGPIHVNVRIIAATNRNIHEEIRKGNFREDLYYRLNVFPITLPALRDRKEDIVDLAKHFIAKFAKSSNKKVGHISKMATRQLVSYPWPGNVRELEHIIERSVLLAQGHVIKEVHLPSPLAGKHPTPDPTTKTYSQNERQYIVEVLNRCNGRIYGPGGAAEIMGLKVSTLNSKIKKLRITKEQIIYLRDV